MPFFPRAWCFMKFLPGHAEEPKLEGFFCLPVFFSSDLIVAVIVSSSKSSEKASSRSAAFTME